MLMAMFTKAIGRTTKLMASANITTPMARAMKGTGARINSTGMARRHGLMELATKVNTKRVKRMAMVNLFGLMAQLIKANLSTIIFMEWEYILGLIKGNITVSG